MCDDVTVTVTITASTEAILAELTPTDCETAAELAAEWVARWCRGHCHRTSIDTLSWPGHTVQMTIRLDAATHAHLMALAREGRYDPVDMASAIVNGRADQLVAAKRRGRLVVPRNPLSPTPP